MYLGRQQLGTWIDIYLQCRDSAKTPTMPDAVPTIRIRDSLGVLVHSGLMPIVERDRALFCTRLLLGAGFAVGTQTVEMAYLIAGATKIDSRTFEISPAGNPTGQVLGMTYFHHPSADSIVYQVESGSILRGKNPKVS